VSFYKLALAARAFGMQSAALIKRSRPSWAKGHAQSVIYIPTLGIKRQPSTHPHHCNIYVAYKGNYNLQQEDKPGACSCGGLQLP